MIKCLNLLIIACIMVLITSCGNRHVTESVVSHKQIESIQQLNEADVSVSKSVSNVEGKSVAASSYQRILPVRIDSTTLKSNKSEELSGLVVKRTETLISNEKSLSFSSDTILKSLAYLKGFSVIAGSFSGIENSIIQINKLKALEYEPFVVKGENEMFRIVVGTFEEIIDADILCFRLENDSIPSWILKK